MGLPTPSPDGFVEAVEEKMKPDDEEEDEVETRREPDKKKDAA
jgi:hypothetical protein